MADIKRLIEEMTTDELLDFLKSQEVRLRLDQEDLNILKNIKISGSSFLRFSKEDFHRSDLQLGPIIAVSSLIEEINNGISHDFLYSYRYVY